MDKGQIPTLRESRNGPMPSVCSSLDQLSVTGVSKISRVPSKTAVAPSKALLKQPEAFGTRKLLPGYIDTTLSGPSPLIMSPKPNETAKNFNRKKTSAFPTPKNI
jgi:hypothetical protein